MKCLVCGGKLRVADVRTRKSNRVWRWRECVDCFTKYTTYETIDISKIDPYIKEKLQKEGVL
jgi:transcriptional regulator NrdR family protein